jgi:phospholipid/cholesterol/gamma-HCH transport system ATP-binding protein
MIKAENIFKSFNGKIVLNDVTASFEPGKTNLIIGARKKKKTVLLKTLVGLHEADSGEIRYNEVLFNRLSFKEKKAMRQHIGMLFQGAALFDFATVEENVMFPLTMFTNKSYEEKRERVNFCLKRVNIIGAEKRYPGELSGGMQKRVGIARAIALNPSYLFCDEPNSGLDPNTSTLIDKLIREITLEYNITTIVNTHDMNSVMEIGDKVLFIYEGKKWWEGSSSDILHADNPELNNFVFASNMTKMLKKLSTK